MRTSGLHTRNIHASNKRPTNHALHKLPPVLDPRKRVGRVPSRIRRHLDDTGNVRVMEAHRLDDLLVLEERRSVGAQRRYKQVVADYLIVQGGARIDAYACAAGYGSALHFDVRYQELG